MIEFKDYDDYALFLDDVVDRNTLSEDNDLIFILGKKRFINTCAIYLALQYKYSVDGIVEFIHDDAYCDSDSYCALYISNNMDNINYNNKKYCVNIIDIDDIYNVSFNCGYVRTFINSDNDEKNIFDIVNACLELHDEVMVFNVL